MARADRGEAEVSDTMSNTECLTLGAGASLWYVAVEKAAAKRGSAAASQRRLSLIA